MPLEAAKTAAVCGGPRPGILESLGIPHKSDWQDDPAAGIKEQKIRILTVFSAVRGPAEPLEKVANRRPGPYRNAVNSARIGGLQKWHIRRRLAGPA